MTITDFVIIVNRDIKIIVNTCFTIIVNSDYLLIRLKRLGGLPLLLIAHLATFCS